MGLKQFLSRLMRRRLEDEALQSLESPLQSPIKALQSLPEFTKEDASITKITDSIASISASSSPISEEIPKPLYELYESRPLPNTIESTPELEKDSFHLGLAAGYTGRSIKGIESALNRIELQMVSKDWFKTEFEDNTPELIGIMKEHDDKMEKHFEIIENTLQSMRGIASTAPEPFKTELTKRIEVVEKQIPLSPKMQQLVSVVRRSGEMSYDDLAQQLGITVSALRGLISNTMRRTNTVERFSHTGKGWIKYVGNA